MFQANAYGVGGATSPLAPLKIQRREPGERDVQIEILFCGVCHSDLHLSRNEWAFAPPAYPVVPGHEIVGRVVKTGKAATKHKVGDLVGVGCLVDSDRTCPACKDGLEPYCNAPVFTYNGPDRHTNGVTYGGYSDAIVVDEHFVLRMPANLRPEAAAPLLCAGITTWTPLRRWGAGKGKRVGVVGLGGLGHMAVKLARAMGAEVTVITRSASKKEDAKRLGASDVVVSTDADAMKKHAGTCDLIVDAVSASHDVNGLINLLRRDGALAIVGVPDKPLSIEASGLLFGRRAVGGSIIGGLGETQEMLDFCGKHEVAADVEVIPVQKLNEAWARMLKSDVKYRFSIDMASIKK
jgi:uncharacterized zinc-type alcohol dehydrogenase-like protein